MLHCCSQSVIQVYLCAHTGLESETVLLINFFKHCEKWSLFSLALHSQLETYHFLGKGMWTWELPDPAIFWRFQWDFPLYIHNKPSILGYPHFGKPPYVRIDRKGHGTCWGTTGVSSRGSAELPLAGSAASAGAGCRGRCMLCMGLHELHELHEPLAPRQEKRMGDHQSRPTWATTPWD